MKELIINIYLFWGMKQDIKERKISNIYLIVGTITGLLFCGLDILTGNFYFEKKSLAWVPGVIFIVTAKIWKEKIGIGDGLILLILGIFVDFQKLCLILYMAFVLLIIVSLLLLGRGKITKNYQIPFLPFLWLAYTLLWGLSYV